MIYVFTGDGKGKTTAAFGTIIRAIGAGKKVLMVQFLKDGNDSAFKMLRKMPSFCFSSFGNGRFIRSADKNDIENVEKALSFVERSLDQYDVFVLDEINVAVDLNLITEDRIIDFIANLPKKKDFVLTGRGASRKMIERADLVTKMKKIKHYYDNGVLARKGFEY